MVTLGAIYMLYILLCCVNGSAQPDETARWLDQRSGLSRGDKPRRFYGESLVSHQGISVFSWTSHMSYSYICLLFILWFSLQRSSSCLSYWVLGYNLVTPGLVGIVVSPSYLCLFLIHVLLQYCMCPECVNFYVFLSCFGSFSLWNII